MISPASTFPLLNVPTKFNFLMQSVPTKRNNVNSLIRVSHQKPETMPEGYIPSDSDVCCGRGKQHWRMTGNVNFRKHIHAAVGRYMAAPLRNHKSAVVASVVDEIRREGGNFIKERKCGSSSHWHDIGDTAAREKVGHSLRDQTNNAATPVKARFAKQANEERRRASLPSLSVQLFTEEETRRRPSLPSSSVPLLREETGRAADDAAAIDCDSVESARQVETSPLPSLSPSSSLSSFSSFTEETTIDDFIPVITAWSGAPTSGSFDISSVLWDTDLQPTDSIESLPFDECHDF
jgi:hypothetical protein